MVVCWVVLLGHARHLLIFDPGWVGSAQLVNGILLFSHVLAPIHEYRMPCLCDLFNVVDTDLFNRSGGSKSSSLLSMKQCV